MSPRKRRLLKVIGCREFSEVVASNDIEVFGLELKGRRGPGGCSHRGANTFSRSKRLMGWLLGHTGWDGTSIQEGSSHFWLQELCYSS